LLIADTGAFGEDLQPWDSLTAAVEDFEDRCWRLADAEARCAELQRRVEESEALHTLGLAANRTLDMDEVLNLVARFTRTLLGAHYVMVNTTDRGRIYTVASVGLRNAEGATEEYHLARTVVEAERPLTIGGAAANLQIENFPFHAAEGMRAGLGIPLSLFGDTFGALIVGYRREYEVTPRDIRLALTLASHAAVAISNARLHETVGARSHELEAAYAELNQLTEAKERFFASINHELRNPIGAILGYQGLLLENTAGELPDAARRFLEKANRAATTLRTLVNDILDLSKIAAGQMEMEIRPCSLPEIIDGVLNTIQPLAEEKGIALVVSGLEGVPVVDTDPHRVQQILVNLLSNAVKFTGQGEVRLALRVRGPAEGSADAEGAEEAVEIRVIDSGPGIAPDDLALVFEEYKQVKGTKGGTGLGLPISRRLARLLGGELWVESEVGAGSCFVLRLPLRSVSGSQPSVA
ncbi:MAG TPA: GAF domain-containing sensor histidine kinase, partial [Longimicrobiaceae bacterium]|nr:GAF domain-containing sensor histidine kinase [Longimicrobiaceae bacterium]